MKISKTILTLGAAVTMLSGSVMAAGDCKGGSSCDGFSGSGAFLMDSSDSLNTTIEAAVPGYFELNSANESGNVFTNSNVRINCVKSLGNNTYVMSGYKVTNSRVTYVDQGIDNASAVGDKMLGQFKILGNAGPNANPNAQGAIQRGNWVTGLETCSGDGVAAIPPIPHDGEGEFLSVEECHEDITNQAEALPDCDAVTPEQLADLPLNRTTRGIDTLTYDANK